MLFAILSGGSLRRQDTSFVMIMKMTGGLSHFPTSGRILRRPDLPKTVSKDLGIQLPVFHALPLLG
jgi:hypothetical protein